MEELIDNYLSYLRVNNKAENTIKNYKVDLKQFRKFMEHNNLNITEVNIQHITNFLATLDKNSIEARGISLSSTTKMRKITSIREFFNYLIKFDIVDKNPAALLEMPKKPVRNPSCLSFSESVNLLNHVDGLHKKRDLAILMVFLNCGLRVSELVNIKLEDIKGNILTIIGKGNKERQIPLNDVCITAINTYLSVRPDVESDYLFISERKKGFTVGGIQYLVKKYYKNAGINIKKYSTHDLRHTAATLMHNNGVDIRTLQEILGHADISTTQIYTHLNPEIKQKAVNNNPLNNYLKK